MRRFRGGLVFKAQILCVSLESNKEEEKKVYGLGGYTRGSEGAAGEEMVHDREPVRQRLACMDVLLVSY